MFRNVVEMKVLKHWNVKRNRYLHTETGYLTAPEMAYLGASIQQPVAGYEYTSCSLLPSFCTVPF